MCETPYKEIYINQLNKLVDIIKITNERIISENPDEFFYNNANFFSKSFLVTMCAYLESYLKDAIMIVVDEVNNRLRQNKLPHNLVKWSLNADKDLKTADYKFQDFEIQITKKILDDFISGNPYRTKELLKKIGIDIDRDNTFNEQKELINTIVAKRNKIIHHNDDASDVTNQDLIKNIEIIIEYISNIDKQICKLI